MDKILNYKNNIKKLNKNNKNNLKRLIIPLLENDFKNNKINESEYSELLEFAKNEYNEEYGFAREQREFRKKYDINPIIMYKGEIGAMAPKRKEDEEEER